MPLGLRLLVLDSGARLGALGLKLFEDVLEVDCDLSFLLGLERLGRGQRLA